MTAPVDRPLEGLVLVLATVGGVHSASAAATGVAIAGSGALLAVVTTDGTVIDDITAAPAPTPPLSWRADPTDPDTWARLVPHIEQRLGPIDAAVADAPTFPLLQPLLEPDLSRRGHGAVVLLSAPPDPLTALVRSLVRTPQPGRPRARDDEPGS